MRAIAWIVQKKREKLTENIWLKSITPIIAGEDDTTLERRDMSDCQDIAGDS